MKGVLTFSDSDELSAVERRRVVRALFEEAELPVTDMTDLYHERDGQEALCFLYDREAALWVRSWMTSVQCLNLASCAYYDVEEKRCLNDLH